jgi:hypothetical protein
MQNATSRVSHSSLDGAKSRAIHRLNRPGGGGPFLEKSRISSEQSGRPQCQSAAKEVMPA